MEGKFDSCQIDHGRESPYPKKGNMHKLRAAAVGSVLLASTFAFPSSASSLVETCEPGHCYAEVVFFTGDFDAVGTDLWTDCLHLDNPTNEMASHEMWMLSDKTGEWTWIEIGYIRGGPLAGGDNSSGFRWFWGERTNTIFATHAISGASTNSWVNASIYKNTGNNNWTIYKGGSSVGTSVLSVPSASQVQVGGETSEPTVYSHGKQRWLQYSPLGTTNWTMGSPAGMNNTATVYTGTFTYTNDSTHWSLQRMCPGVSGPFSAKKVPTESSIIEEAKKFAASNGEKNPVISTVKSKRKDVNKLTVGSTSSVDSDQDVMLVEMRGKFDGSLASRPKGAKPPTGTVMTIAYDVATGNATDWTLSDKRSDMSKLGSVKTVN